MANEQSFHCTHQPINHIIQPILAQFDRFTKNYALFNFLFLTLLTLEIGFFLLLFHTLLATSYIAICLAAIVLTLFAYSIIRQYLLTKRPDQLENLKNKFIKGYQSLFPYHPHSPENLLALASACCKLADQLQNREASYYQPPKGFRFLSSLLQKISRWYHWEDVFSLKEHLLKASVEEHIKLVKCEPTNLQVHAALANAYVMLSGLYIDPKKLDAEENDSWIPTRKYSNAMVESFRVTAQKAIEEFTILSDFAPNDPWVHAQLAYSYHDLQMPDEEIRAYETILQLRPNDADTLLKLGKLYFQQGSNAQGLKTYEELKQLNPKHADTLIRDYDAYQPETT